MDYGQEAALDTSATVDAIARDAPAEGDWGEETALNVRDDPGADPSLQPADPEDGWDGDVVSEGVVIGDTEEPSVEDVVSTGDTEDDVIDDREVYPDEPSDDTVDANDELA